MGERLGMWRVGHCTQCEEQIQRYHEAAWCPHCRKRCHTACTLPDTNETSKRVCARCAFYFGWEVSKGGGAPAAVKQKFWQAAKGAMAEEAAKFRVLPPGRWDLVALAEEAAEDLASCHGIYSRGSKSRFRSRCRRRRRRSEGATTGGVSGSTGTTDSAALETPSGE